ncbi:MAG: TlpA family protein disulfide reductase [Phycisphaerae bacterium]|nr:TlpA family protein disulfide reductase [Phycisphaerae bacterium]
MRFALILCWLSIASATSGVAAHPARAQFFNAISGSPHDGSPPATSQPTTRPDDEVAFEPSADLTPSECAAIAEKLLDRDEFERASLWYQAARDRTTDAALIRRISEQVSKLELLGRTAPRLSTDEWLQGSMPPGSQLQNKVIVILFFEMIEPEIKHEIDAMNDLMQRLAPGELEIIGVASVLGDSEHQQRDDIRAYLTDQRVAFRVGLDAGGVMSLNTYRGQGTPHYAVIDRAGRVRYLGAGPAADVEYRVRRLLAERRDKALPGRRLVMPMSRTGRELIDTRAPRLVSRSWANTPNENPPELAGRVRLIRFFTDDCPSCRATLPTLSRIYRDYSEEGLSVVGIYYPKSGPRVVNDDEFRSTIRRLELEFPCMPDADWSFLDRIWLKSGDAARSEPREHKCATFLLDRRGRIRFIHPGPDFYPSSRPAEKRQDEDYRAVRAAIEKLLAE